MAEDLDKGVGMLLDKVEELGIASLLRILKNEQREGHEKLLFEHVGGKAMIKDDWKIVDLRGSNPSWHLYNLAGDPTETNNLAENYPEKFETVIQAWEEWGREMELNNNQLSI